MNFSFKTLNELFWSRKEIGEPTRYCSSELANTTGESVKKERKFNSVTCKKNENLSQYQIEKLKFFSAEQ